MSEESIHQPHHRWKRPFVTKVVLIVIILLISFQYLVNVAVFRQNGSIIFLRLLDSSVEKMLNQSGLIAQESMRESVTKVEKKLNKSCPVIPPKLQGRVKVNVQVSAWAYIEKENTMLSPGGRYKPADCLARHRVAIIIPFRDREIHLKIFLKNIHPFLRRQQIDYGIFVVEMASNIKFNRALLMNVGFVEAMKQYDYQCFIFHDVDLLPEDDRNLYTCPQTPRHMSVAIDRMKYKLPYSQIFGGVSAIATDHFKKINGFSNIYFGWGGEDDDMYRRILYSNLTVIRYSPEVARYKMLVHAKDNGNNDRFMLLRTVKARRLTDGLSSLKYKLEKLEFRPLYTWILVSVNETELLDAEPIHKMASMNLKRKAVQFKPKVQFAKASKRVQVNVVQNDTKGKRNADASQKAPKQISGNKTKKVDKVDVSTGNVKKVDVKEKIASIPKKKPSVPNPPMKHEVISSVAKRRNPTVVSWIPREFKGTIPKKLNQFDPLPVMVPNLVRKRKPLVQQKIANRKAAQIQAKKRSQNTPNHLKAQQSAIKDVSHENVKTAHVNSIGQINVDIPASEKVKMVNDHIPKADTLNIDKQIHNDSVHR